MSKNNKPIDLRSKVLKVDEDLGLVLGIAIICTEDGEPYYDTQGDHIPEDVMLKAAFQFAEDGAVAGEMHETDDNGEIEKRGHVVFVFPLTEDIAKAYDIEANYTGLLIAVKPDEDMLEKFHSGELTGFSIGGKCKREKA